MKKHISVFGLFARTTFLKISVIMLLSFAAQVFFFILAIKQDGLLYSPHVYADGSLCPLTFAISFVIITALLCADGCSFSSKTGYTLKRLYISEKSTMACQAVYNAIVYMIFLFGEACLMFILCKYAVDIAPKGELGASALFISFYKSKFLHALIPLHEIILWIRNIFLLAAISLSTAAFPYKQRRKKVSIFTIFLTVFAIICFPANIADSFNGFLTIAVSSIIICYSVFLFISEEVPQT